MQLVRDHAEQAAETQPAIGAIAAFFEAVLADRDKLILPLHGGPKELDDATIALQSEIRKTLQSILDRGREDDTIGPSGHAGRHHHRGALSRRGVILWESGHFARFFFPSEDVSVDRLGANAVNPSPEDDDGGELLPGHIELPFDAMDRWFEEDDPIYAHPRDPYHRVDVRSASCEVVVRFGDSEIARSKRPKLLFETGVPTRYYLPFNDVRIGLLSLSDTVSECPYKGDGQHWHLQVGDTRVEDVGWSLPHPLPEGAVAAEHISFYAEKVHIEVDGTPRP